MKHRGKAVVIETKPDPPEFNYSATDQFPCKKHPSSPIGICAYCLKERLIELVCSDCGEQRLSSCSCSDLSSNRNSSATDAAGAGSGAGRISFLIENDLNEPRSKPDEGNFTNLLLKGRRRGGIWRIVRLFKRKREKGEICSERRNSVGDGNETWVFDYVGVSRSRSLCSFRGGSFREDSDFGFSNSSAKVSDFNGNSSGFDSERPSGFSEKSGLKECDWTKRSVFPVKESEFGELGEAGFIDLKLDLEAEARKEAEYSVLKGGDLIFPVSVEDFGGGGFAGKHERRGIFRRGGSCRVTVEERGRKKEKRGYKGWRWIFRQNPNWRSESKKDEVYVS